ncbi:hypothetical protein K439DRAFT_1622087 [Ramaria rubella]|nr:hypothetical protein K439DRAFT_1622087 [Ramaria rubella]
MPSPTPPPHLHQTLRPSPDPLSACPPSLGADTSAGPMPPRVFGACGHQVDIPTLDHAMSAGDEDNTSGGVSDADEMAVDPTRNEEGSKYILDGHVSMLDGMRSQTLDANASEEDDLQADDHQDDCVDDNEEGNELRSADNGEGGVTDLATHGLTCDPDVPLPLNGLVSPFPLEGHTYVPGTMDDLISVTCHLAQNFASQGWVTKEGTSKSQIPLQDVLGVMYGSVDVFSRHTITWEPVSVEEGDLDHPPGTSRPDACASATEGVVKPDRATANHAPGPQGRMRRCGSSCTPCTETGDPHFTRQHLVAMFMDLISCLPLRSYEVLSPSLMVPRPAQFFQGIAEQGDISMYGRSGTFWSWGKAQRGAWFAALCHNDRDQRLGLRCMRVGHPAPTQEFPVFSRFVCAIPVKECLCLCHLGRTDNHFRSKMIDPTLFQLFWAAGFPTRAGLAADPGIRAYIMEPSRPHQHTLLQARLMPAPVLLWELANPNLPQHPLTHRTLPCVWGARQCHPGPPWHVNPLEEGPYCPPLHTNRPFLSQVPCAQHCTIVAWPNVRILDIPDPLLSSPAPTPRLRLTQGRTCVVELPPPRHTQSPLLACCLSKWARSASGGPLGEDTQAMHLTCHTLRGLIPGGMQVCGHPPVWDASAAPRFPWGFRALAFTHGSDVTHPMGFQPPGQRCPALAAPVGMHPDIVGSDHQGAIVNMYLELSRTEWWALSDRCEVLSEWCKDASMPV